MSAGDTLNFVEGLLVFILGLKVETHLFVDITDLGQSLGSFERDANLQLFVCDIGLGDLEWAEVAFDDFGEIDAVGGFAGEVEFVAILDLEIVADVGVEGGGVGGTFADDEDGTDEGFGVDRGVGGVQDLFAEGDGFS